MDDESFAAFVAARRPALLGTAVLLTGDRSSAEELVQRALGRARRAPAAQLDAAALQRLVDGATSRWHRSARSPQVIESLPDPFAGPGADGSPDLAASLRELPARTRAVVVLRWHERLPDARIAELVRCPVAAVTAAAAQGLAALGPALAPSVYERAPADERPVEQRLAAGLAALAAAPARWRLAEHEVVPDLRTRRSAGRRRLAAATLGAACLAGVAVPLARWAPDVPVSAPAAETSTAPPSVIDTSPAPVVPSVPVLAGPTRGSLATDEAFLAAARDRWTGPDAPPPAERSVVFAGDTPHGRAVLLVGTGSDLQGVWLLGPAGAAPGELTEHLPRHLGRERPQSLLLGGPGEGTLLVLAAPGDRIGVSPRLLTGPGGGTGRTYTSVPTVDGVAQVPASTVAEGPAISVRVTRSGQEVYRSGVEWAAAEPQQYVPPPGVTPLRTAASAPDQLVLGAALRSLAVPLGLAPAELRPELLWTGELPLSRGPGSVVVVAGRSVEGAMLLTTWAGGGGGAVGCGTQSEAGSTDLTTLTVARVCDVALPGLGPTDDGRWLVLTAPVAAAAAEVLDRSGAVLATVQLTGGSTVTQLPDGASRVRTLDAADRPLLETTIASPSPVPFGDFGSGLAR